MPTPWRRSLRLTRRTLSYGVLVLLILAALLVSIANLCLPFVENNPQRVKQWLSGQIGKPVDFQSSHTQWTRRGPKISLTGLRVGEGDGMVSIGRADLLVSVYSGLLPNHPFTELKIKGLLLRFNQQQDDRWQLYGVPRQADSKRDALEALSGFGELQLENTVLQVTPKNKAPIRIPRIDMRLRVQGAKLSVGLRAESQPGDLPLFLVAKLNRENYSGTVWLGAPKLNMANWIALAPQLNLPKLHAQVKADVWVDVRQRKIMRLHSQLGFMQVSFDKPAEQKIFSFSNSPALFDSVAFESHWQRRADGWDFTIPEINFSARNVRRNITGIRVQSIKHSWRGQADSVDIQALASLNPAASSYLPAVQRFLRDAQLKGTLSKLKAHGNRVNKQWSVSGFADTLSMSAIRTYPGFQRLSGTFVADQSGGSFMFRPTKASLDWPVAFGRSIPSTYAGTVLWWKTSADWVLAAKELQWQGEGMRANIDMQLQFYADKRKPMLNVAARLATFDFETAKHFWLQHLMSPKLMEWLNMALVKGQVQDASIVIAGDLEHWPFADKHGRFSAQTTITADQFKFLSDWPAAEHAVLHADFNGPGFSVFGKADYMGNPLILNPSGIAKFKEAKLLLGLDAESSMQALMPVVNGTPLKRLLGESVYSLQGEGPVAVKVGMRFPLTSAESKSGESNSAAGQNEINGTIDFKGASIRAPLWKIAMQQATGQAGFTHLGFSAKDISGLIDANPVKLDLRVGQPYTQNKANHFEAAVRGNFDADYLLDFDKSLHDLKKALQGKSPWLFTVSSPLAKNQSAAPVFLRAQSELVGSQILLPEPLNKPRAKAQSFNLLTPLPVDKGVIDLRVGDQFRLLLKKPLNKPLSGVALFGSQTQADIPTSGFAVRGQAERFDVASWLALANKAEDGVGLQSFDLIVNRLSLAGQNFGNTRLLMNPTPSGMAIRAQGVNLDGQIHLPKAKNALITANFTTVHVLPAEKKVLAAEAPMAVVIDFGNPAELPPVSLVVQDIHIGDVDLGRCEMQTQPSAQGLLIQKLSTQSPLMALNATGLWQGQNNQARTSLQATIVSKDLGRLLTAFHYQDVIKSGNTKAQFTGAWTGSPLDFSLKSFNGNLTLDVAKGQLLGVEPGGGRVLGLISLAEIPRRLSFNFSDFFDKGFGFNQIKGQFFFSQGKATTQDLAIQAPAADIKITGSTDLVKQEFNQQVDVRAKTSGLLPVIGAVAGGPIGAAAGVMAQAVLDKPLKETAAVSYVITGPWAKPDITKTDGRKK